MSSLMGLLVLFAWGTILIVGAAVLFTLAMREGKGDSAD